MTILTLGELLVDMFPSEQGKRLTEVPAFHPKPGGAPANVAVAARRLGAPAAFIGKVGDDAFGLHLIGVLKAEGVETRGIALDHDARTTMAFIAMPDPNHAEFVFYRNPGADFRLEKSELDRNLLHDAQVFHFGSLSLNHEPARSATWTAIELARAGGALISFDVNYRPALWADPSAAIDLTRKTIPMVDMVKVNEDELALLSGMDIDPANPATLQHAAEHLLGQGVKAVIMTLGPNGSAYCLPGGVFGYVAGFPVDAIDAVGCGDAFVAGLLTRLAPLNGDLASRPAAFFDDALRFANAVGALTSLTSGVIPALPSLDQVKRFLAERE